MARVQPGFGAAEANNFPVVVKYSVRREFRRVIPSAHTLTPWSTTHRVVDHVTLVCAVSLKMKLKRARTFAESPHHVQFSGFQPAFQLVWFVGVSTSRHASRHALALVSMWKRASTSNPPGQKQRQTALLRIAVGSRVLRTSQTTSILLGMELRTPVCSPGCDNFVKTEFVPCE